MYCNNCGKKLKDNAKKCPKCGTPAGATVVNVYNQSQPVNALGYVPKKKWKAFWLCLFLGMFGIHRFYVNKWGTGVLYFFTMGLGGAGWFHDLGAILKDRFTDSRGMPVV